ncbi:hypothetical protein [Bradyrhizobium iriomotense]|uniref:Uncharacterized protein n=1 Tax=Bradyrhizobium iriomotense TaxID=441950 RepID=A0ABQ6AS43_9BRAD|nr:hypothetical protein [Bradyrhizobium iriomotense]GLR84255.1 hypothetical protein GCM10007857_09650 [Bradyrhizobium iriomotense]
MFKRNRLKRVRERLAAFATEMREKASRLPPGIEQENLLRKARQADVAARLDEWATSRGLQPPK